MSRTDASLTLPAPDPDLIAALTDAGVAVAARATDRLSRAHDASHYLFTPQVVVTPVDSDGVSRVLEVSRRRRVPVTFRSGGTSLSGQAGTDGILVDTRRHLRAITVLDGGDRVRAQPGATIRAVNTRLLRHGRKLGPDPASEIACTVGGVVANNSSGMACGIHANTYRTLESAVIVLPGGTVLDTGAADADERLRREEPALRAGLIALRDRIRASPESVGILLAAHALKNTMGYGLNSFLDFDEPVRILEHLLVGSEGTLGFVAEATFMTVPIRPHAATGLLVFADLAGATAALPSLIDLGCATIELLDSASLRVAQRDPQATSELTGLAVERHAALLVEFQEETADDLDRRLAGAAAMLAGLPLAAAAALTTDGAVRARLWHIRKGLYTAVAGARPLGTTALLEDIAVPVAALNATCDRLTELFDEHRYEGAVIFGHAKDGNIHFLINERFDDPRSLARYEAFTEEMVDLVLSHGGTLKAEHGTGRIMAPYVRRQYGDELYEVMWAVKRLFDPHLLVNPGVILTDDPAAHIAHLKTSPAVEEEVDRCVECGYCEPVCPSRDLTLTPRERIVLRRELQRARSSGDVGLVSELEREYDYDGVQTCAVDGMCQTACPVLINTGDLVRRLRSEKQTALSQTGWDVAAKGWGVLASAGGAALTVADALPAAIPRLATRVGRAVLGPDTVPSYSTELPAGGARRRARSGGTGLDAVYFPSCTNTLFGPAGGSGVSAAFQRLCDRAGVRLSTPADVPSLCCGTPWKSKGLTAGYTTMQERVVASLLTATHGGALPVVSDATSCTEGLELMLASAGVPVTVVDAVAFVDDVVLPRLPRVGRERSLTVHPTCSSTRLGVNPALMRVAAAAADTVVVPDDWGCCAFAGDRGMLRPELTAAATAAESDEVRQADSSAHASVNRTCELGMTRATGHAYQHVLEVLDAAVSRGAAR